MKANSNNQITLGLKENWFQFSVLILVNAFVGGMVGLERYISGDVKRKLARMGHKISPELGTFGGYQGIWRKPNPGRYFGASDPRKDGCAIGY